jgi:hypothetical protein
MSEVEENPGHAPEDPAQDCTRPGDVDEAIGIDYRSLNMTDKRRHARREGC